MHTKTPFTAGRLADAVEIPVQPIYLQNTLTKQLELFSPLKPGHVSMYHCGPTVYNFVHIGNLRAFIEADTLRRLFEYNDYTVTQVMNITDIGHLQSDEDDGEDKMTLALKREGKELTKENMREVANRFYDAFRNDLERVNAHPAHLYPFASDHIEEDIAFVQKLLDTGHAYPAGNGIYFDTNSLLDYGKLGGVQQDDDARESRIGDDSVQESEKKNARDFAVWKFNPELGYDADFGKGFPGWHLECSVMSMKYLGDTFDIHTGGIDHIPVHHNNEIAQSEAISGKLLANYWLHNAHIIIEGGKKMAKSGDKFLTLDAITELGVSPLGLRYWLLGASYQTPMTYSDEALKQAEQGYQNLVKKLLELMDEFDASLQPNEDADQAQAHFIVWKEKFLRLINSNMDTAGALALAHTILKNPELSAHTKLQLIFDFDRIFGLDLEQAVKDRSERIAKNRSEGIPSEVQNLAEQRQIARAEKNWSEADRLRKVISDFGYEVVDSADGYGLEKIMI